MHEYTSNFRATGGTSISATAPSTAALARACPYCVRYVCIYRVELAGKRSLARSPQLVGIRPIPAVPRDPPQDLTVLAHYRRATRPDVSRHPSL
jgi:hypothetical protein